MEDLHCLLKKLAEHGQGHLVEWLNALNEEHRCSLTAELAALDFDLVDRLAALLGSESKSSSWEDLEPAPVLPMPMPGKFDSHDEELAAEGRRTTRNGDMAVLIVAGGHGTRLGHSGPKGTYPITPVTGKCLFQHDCEKLLAARRKWQAELPLYIMTSPDNHEQTAEFFAQNNWFGLESDSVNLFAQGTLPILSPDGRLLLKKGPVLFRGPDGHGGVADALVKSGMLDDMRNRGCRYISYLQVDNPLVRIIDNRFIGYHVSQGSEFSSKVIARRDENEGLGMAVLANSKPAVLEYVDIQEDERLIDLTSARNEQGGLIYKFGSIAVHLIDISLLERAAGDGSSMPLHMAKKNYEILSQTGKLDIITASKCIKFERFVFDVINIARRAVFVETDRCAEFAPVKKAGGPDEEDTPGRAADMMMRQWGDWLSECGFDVFDRPKEPHSLSRLVEISPLFALGPDELKSKHAEIKELIDNSSDSVYLD